MDATQFFIAQESRKYEQNCRSAISQVRRASSMWEVKRASHVISPSVLRGMGHHCGAARDLRQEAASRLESMLNEQLKAAAALTSPDERKAYLGQLRLREWDALRGEFATLYRKADMEARRLLSLR